MYRNAVSSRNQFNFCSINEHRNTLKDLRHYDDRIHHCCQKSHHIKEEVFPRNSSKYFHHCNDCAKQTKYCCDDRRTKNIDLLYQKNTDSTLRKLLYADTRCSTSNKACAKSSVLYVSKIYRYERY